MRLSGSTLGKAVKGSSYDPEALGASLMNPSKVGSKEPSGTGPMRQLGTLMELSLVQAAKEAGKSKSSIHRAIKSGRLSAQRYEDGTYSIDPSELFRVFPKDAPEPSPLRQREPSGTPSVSEEILKVKVQMLEAQLEREQETVADLRRRLDKAEDRILSLSHRPESSMPEGSQAQPRQGFLGFLRSQSGDFLRRWNSSK